MLTLIYVLGKQVIIMAGRRGEMADSVNFSETLKLQGLPEVLLSLCFVEEHTTIT
jgi:hypothetical protein